jgi:hypothetical protein
MAKTKDIVRFCAEECARQGSGEVSVANMFDAWFWMLSTKPHCVLDTNGWKIVLNAELILQLGKMIDPRNYSWRTVPVSIRNTDNNWIASSVIPVIDFDRALFMLCQSSNDGTITAETFYKEFEKIHPFIDGNGRVGCILYNALLSSLNDPRETPDLKDPGFFTRKDG